MTLTAHGAFPGKEVKAMNTFGQFVAVAKTVFVRSYLRFRNEKWETVVSHFRRPPHTAV